jgi:uncharacterized cupredoxin-like copper-binding protein
LLIALAAIAVLAVGCGSDSGPSDDELTIEVQAQNVRFRPDVIEVPAGRMVTLRLKNLDVTEHDLEVRDLVPTSISGGGHEGHGEPIRLTKVIAVHADASGTATIKFQADQKGTYEVVCTIPGHEQAGMVARLVVV